MQITQSTSFPAWIGDQLKFTFDPADAITWTRVTGPYAPGTTSSTIGPGGYTITG